SWDPAFDALKVEFDCEPRISALFDVQSLFTDSLVYWGFTGATGGAWNNQTVCLDEYILSVGPAVTICNGASTQLVVGGDPQGAFSWSPGESLDDPTSATPFASPSETTTYTVSFADLCGEQQMDTVTVAVDDLEVFIESPPQLDCSSLGGELSATTNFLNDIGYSWTSLDGQILSGANSSSPEVGAPGTYVVTADFDDVCFAMDSVVVEGNYDFEVEIDAAGTVVNCDSPILDLDADASFQFNVDYTWTTVDGTIDTSTDDDQIEVSSGGTYTVSASLNEFCTDEASVTIQENFDVAEIDAGPDQILNCYDPSIQLDGSAMPDDGIIFWSTSGGNIV
ncbi:MAG: hypothetical protein HKN32_02230, partial [Flavobacteriales bacterium]|nr:hypothetical protein [Flavobacteriales bacterium]